MFVFDASVYNYFSIYIYDVRFFMMRAKNEEEELIMSMKGRCHVNFLKLEEIFQLNQEKYFPLPPPPTPIPWEQLR